MLQCVKTQNPQVVLGHGILTGVPFTISTVGVLVDIFIVRIAELA